MRALFCVCALMACGGYPQPVKNQRPAGWVTHDPQALPTDTDDNDTGLGGTCEQNGHLCLEAKPNGACPDKRTLYDAFECVEASLTCCDSQAESACPDPAPTCEVCGMSTTAVCGDFGWECPPPPSSCPS